MTVTKSIAKPGQVPAGPAGEELPPLRRVASYDVFAPIARGGGGSVWLAFDRKSPALRRVVAVKFVHNGGRDDEDSKRRFLREATIGSSIRHTNVVEVLEVGEQDGQGYIVMPYIEGVDVRALGQSGALPIDVALTIFADALRGLDAAHEARTIDGQPSGVVHRDLSPHNLLVGVDGTTKLTDFGIARPLEGPDQSVTGWAEGKVAYFSPEQARGEPLDRRSDVFAAGIVLWELLTSKALFSDKDPFVTAHRVQTMRVPAPSAERRDVPAALDGVALVALARRPEERHATAAAMLSALLAAATQAGIVLGPEVVAEYVRSHASAHLAERAEVVRRAVAAIQGSQVAPVAAVAVDGPAVSSRRSRVRQAVLALVALALLLGAVGLFLSRKKADPALEPAAASSVASSGGGATTASAIAVPAGPGAGSAAPVSSTSPPLPAAHASSAPSSSSRSVVPASRDRRTRPPVASPSAPRLPMNTNPF